jgi:phage/plasmid-like protein (TIGR03299 family)
VAHELDFSKGYAAMFARSRLPVWHELGQRLDNPPTVEEALRLGGLDFEVMKVPTIRVLPNGTTQENELAHSTIRTDTGAELGMVGRSYTVLQNAEALAVLQPLLDKGWCSIESSGALRGGADIWVAVSWDLNRFGEMCRKVFLSDPRGLLPYSVIRNNHSGRSNVVGMDVTICPVCANTLGMALNQAGVSLDEQREGKLGQYAFSVPHRTNVVQNLRKMADEMWANRVAMFELVAMQYDLLKRTVLQPEAFKKLVLQPLCPDPRLSPRWQPEARMAASVVARHEERVNRLTHLWTNGAGHTGDHSAWEAYNGVVEALDHDVNLWPNRSGVYRTQALLDGQLGQAKRETINRLVAYATSLS